MSYFRNFDKVAYQFGTLSELAAHVNISQYVDLVDRIKDSGAFYSKYTILDGERPDSLSFQIYGTDKYYWTFFLMNDHVRGQGWPMTVQELYEKVQSDKANTVLTSQADLSGIFKVGSTVIGVSSGETGVIIKRNLDLGQLFIRGSHSFNNTESIQTTENTVVSTIVLTAATAEYNAIHHYEDADNFVTDINPYSAPSVLLTPVTFHDNYITANDALREIVVLKPSVVEAVYTEFQDEMRS